MGQTRKIRGGRVRTRASIKRAMKSYRRRRKLSKCRGKKKKTCKRMRMCKVAKGKKRTFCRSTKSHRRRSGRRVVHRRRR
jgi:hypothetical protein